MKKKTIQLTKKLILQKENIAALSGDKQSELLGGALTVTGCPSVACATNISCRNCTSPGFCGTYATRGCGCLTGSYIIC